MDLSAAPESENVIDQRGMKVAGGAVAGGGGLLLLVLGLVVGVDTSKIMPQGGGPQPRGGEQGAPPADGYKKFASKIVGTLESVWTEEFKDPKNRYPIRSYEPPKLVLFTS